MNYQRLMQSIQRHEGLRLKPYLDTVGKLTIGYGRNLDDIGIDETEAGMMLQTDMHKVIQQMTSVAEWQGISDVRQNVLLEMSYNLGFQGLQSFHRMWAAIRREEYNSAADEMMNSKWARQVGNRAVKLSTMMRSGEWH